MSQSGGRSEAGGRVQLGVDLGSRGDNGFGGDLNGTGHGRRWRVCGGEYSPTARRSGRASRRRHPGDPLAVDPAVQDTRTRDGCCRRGVAGGHREPLGHDGGRPWGARRHRKGQRWRTDDSSLGDSQNSGRRRTFRRRGRGGGRGRSCRARLRRLGVAALRSGLVVGGFACGRKGGRSHLCGRRSPRHVGEFADLAAVIAEDGPRHRGRCHPEDRGCPGDSSWGRRDRCREIA